jgi:LCP family protein required for cell wall assembly
VVFAWRAASIVQAHLRRTPFGLRRWSTSVTAFLLLLTIGMHALPAFYAAKGIETLSAITLEGRASRSADLTGPDMVIPPPKLQPDVQRGERVTILFVGVDFEAGRSQHLTDTMLVATLDPKSGKAAMVSVPRDLYGVPLGDGRTYDAKLNSLMATAAADPATYPLGGPGSLKAAIGELLGTDIHYFAAIDIAGLRSVIDTIGGVDIVVESPIYDPTLTDPATNRALNLQPGQYHMSGGTALMYARSREGIGESDFTRADRQQRLLTAIAEKLTQGNVLLNLPGLLDAVRDNVATDIPAGRLAELSSWLPDVKLGSIERVVLTPPSYVTPEPASAAGYILHPQLAAIRDLGSRIFAPPAS